ncbi:hypothetical protein NDU88_004659 [Pleurodeles waltl]|uniref:Uncharacterized protein n=1 Tax=Pleurodeles waltl TaxID=8319 RepID=A0AAV7NPY5_PLEWA|nr:hypothetical protein NDU88_004659 [Pleurodeles waltl]
MSPRRSREERGHPRIPSVGAARDPSSPPKPERLMRTACVSEAAASSKTPGPRVETTKKEKRSPRPDRTLALGAHHLVMPGNEPSNKHLGKPARQLLFSEALRQNRAPPSAPQEHLTNHSSDMADASRGATMDRILQEISAVGHRLERMDSRMISLTDETKSMRLDIAGFQSRVTTLEQRVTLVETQATLAADRDQELLYIRSKVIDLKVAETMSASLASRKRLKGWTRSLS